MCRVLLNVRLTVQPVPANKNKKRFQMMQKTRSWVVVHVWLALSKYMYSLFHNRSYTQTKHFKKGQIKQGFMHCKKSETITVEHGRKITKFKFLLQHFCKETQ